MGLIMSPPGSRATEFDVGALASEAAQRFLGERTGIKD